MLRFLLTFGGVYLLLALLYQAYLEVPVGSKYPTDFFTHLVAVQSKELIGFFGYPVNIMPHPWEESIKLFVNGEVLLRIVEGCNGISVLILFITFVLAFRQRWMKTMLFAFAGAVLLYVMNVLRIALLAIGVYEFSQYHELMHKILFPMIIYGTVFLLWFLWVHRFAKNPTK